MCQALHYMTTYDQLNLPNIAAAELLNLRRQLIESAHEYNPDLPDYGANDEPLPHIKVSDTDRLCSDPSIDCPALRRATTDTTLEDVQMEQRHYADYFHMKHVHSIDQVTADTEEGL